MTLEEFFHSLDEQNPRFEYLRKVCVHLSKESRFGLERKDRDLVEVVASQLSAGLFPMIDKKTRMVFGVEDCHHQMLKSALFQYHAVAQNDNRELTIDDEADLWITNGMGYQFVSTPRFREVISGVRRHRISTVHSYRPDRFDRDLFKIYDVEYIC